jgi:5'-3' exonuclease
MLLLAHGALLPPRTPLLTPRTPRSPRANAPSMGVPGFMSWLEATAPEALLEISAEDPPRHADVVAFDLNALVHTALRGARDEDHALIRVFQGLHTTLRHVQPHQSVILALDGAAPLAKMETQRKRRAKTSGRESKGAKGLSALCATPGTRFMARMEQSLTYCKARLRHGTPRP